MKNKSRIETIQSIAVVLAITGILAVLAKFLGKLTNDIIGASVIALIIGMAIHPLIKNVSLLKPGLNFVSSKMLKFGIILTGATLSLADLAKTGSKALIMICCVFVIAFGLGELLKRLLHLNWKLSSLMSIGTAICGGTAIAAVAPVIDADDSDVAYSISLTFLFDMVVVILLPIIGHMAGLTDANFGLWAGTAVNDTSSVVAAGYAFSDAAGMVAVVVKLARTLMIVPMVVIFSIIAAKKRKADNGAQTVNKKGSVLKIFPWFVVGFVVLAALGSIIDIPSNISAIIGKSSKFVMIMALGAIGMKTDITMFVKKGAK
ncbi:MAG: putative sulfate exporter family transporter, partial [Oscillospiraceae bacterium]